jgi:hypothetical protein
MILLDEISRQIHEHAVAKAARYLVAEAELLSAIIEVDRSKLYEKFGETYLTPYCVKYLNLSEDVAPIFVRVARKSLQVPELELAVQEGLQITKAKTIASVIDQSNKAEWIEKARTLSKEKLEREVAAVNPSALRVEKAKPTGPDRVRVEFEVSFEDAEILKRARELMSQKKNKQAQIGETYATALRDWVDREDPVRKAERAQERKKQKVSRAEQRESGDPEKSGITKSEITKPGSAKSRSEKSGIDKRASENSGMRQSGIEKSRVEKSKTHRSWSSIPAEILHQVHLRYRGGGRTRMPDGANR